METFLALSQKEEHYMTDALPKEAEPRRLLDWDLALEKLLDNISHVQDDIVLMHADHEFLNPDTRKFKALKDDLARAEEALFRAKEVRWYLARLTRDAT
jgi:hypothetical protein